MDCYEQVGVAVVYFFGIFQAQLGEELLDVQRELEVGVHARGDEIGIPVVVSNYLDKPQAVSIVLQDAPWFDRLEETAERSVELGPNEVRSVHFRIRARAIRTN